MTDLLCINFKNMTELNTIIDKKILSDQPKFVAEEIIVAGQAFDLYRRNILECVRALYGDPEHAQYLCFAPECHYANKDQMIRVFHNFHTGRWWWDTQVGAIHWIAFVISYFHDRKLWKQEVLARRLFLSSCPLIRLKSLYFATKLHIPYI